MFKGSRHSQHSANYHPAAGEEEGWPIEHDVMWPAVECWDAKARAEAGQRMGFTRLDQVAAFLETGLALLGR